MTRIDFGEVIAYITAAIGKPLSTDAVEVYYDLLGDLEPDVLRLAAKRVVLEHRWATFPTAAELREAAAETMRGEVKELSPAEAWDLAWRAAGKIDLEISGSFERACNGLPPILTEAMRSFGVPALCYGKEPVGVVRGQFLKIFEQLAARDRRRDLLPAAMKADIQAIGERQRAMPMPVRQAIAQIGAEAEETTKARTA